MFYRFRLFQLLCITSILYMCQCVPVKILKTKPKKNDIVSFKAKCIYKVKEEIPSATFTIALDTSITKFKSKKVTVLSEDGNNLLVENTKKIKPTRFVVVFSGNYAGNASTPLPTGTCSNLQLPTSSTSKPSTTSQPVTTTLTSSNSFQYSVPATISNSWPVGDATRFQAECSFRVRESTDPETKFFNISMDIPVTNYEHYIGKTLNTESYNAGSWFYITNLYHLHAPRMDYSFQATFEGDDEPNIMCYSELPEFTTTTTVKTTVSTTTAATTTPKSTTSPPNTTTSTTDKSTTSSTTTATTSETTTDAKTTSVTTGPATDLPYTVKAIIQNEWEVANCTRFKAVCMLDVAEVMASETVKINVSMGTGVSRFESTLSRTITPSNSESGDWFLVKNSFELSPPLFAYVFHATHTGDSKLNVMCHSSLPAYTGSTTTVDPNGSTPSTTTQKPTDNTDKTDMTTKKTTTEQSTTTQSPTTTNGVSVGVDVQIVSSWSEGDTTRMNGKCEFTITQEVPADGFKIRLEFSSPTERYQDWSWNAIDMSTTGRWYYRSNKHNLQPTTVSYEFQVSVSGSTLPTGRCYANGGGGTNPTGTPTVTGLTKTTQEMTTIPFNSKFNYADAIHKSMLFFYAQRSGKLPADNPIPWRGDSALGDKGDNNEDLTGGWYDAGDMVKFNFPMASTTTLLALGMYRWPQAYESIGLTDKMLDTLRWPLDYFLKCWNSDTANPKYYGQVGNGVADHGYWGRPEDMTMARPAYSLTKDKPGSDVAAETTAALAIGSKLFRNSDSAYADQMLKAAIELYDFADSYRGKYSDSIPDAAAFYRSWSGYTDELMFTATILHNITGNSDYLSKARQAHVDGKYDTAFEKAWALSWDDKRIAAQLFMYDQTGEEKYRALVDNFLDRYRGENVPEKVTQTPQGLAWRDNWGSLRYAANAAFLALMAAESGIDSAANRAWAFRQINYMLGDNDKQFSFVVGFGNDYPQMPHHRAASCPNKPQICNWQNYQSSSPNPHDIVGALVGGPDSNDVYVDERHNFQTNEVACDYNSGFQSALAGLVQLVNGDTSTATPPVTTEKTTPKGSTQPPQTTSTAEPGTTTKPPVSNSKYNEVLRKSILFYRAQRSGDLPEVPASDPVSWRKDSALYDGNDVSLDLTGGWYDAGDYVKFNLPISSATAILSWSLVQWKDAYQKAGEYANMLDSIKWPLDFFLKCWREDTQEFYAQVGHGTTDHSWMGRPEDMTQQEVPRPAYKVTKSRGGSDVAGTVVAAFAAGSIAFKTEDPSYSSRLLTAAKSLYSFADTYRALYTDEVTDAKTYYASSDYKDDLLYAAAMLYKATNDTGYLTDAENKYNEFGFDYQTSWALDWDNKLMAAKLLLYEATGKTKYSRDISKFLLEWRPNGNVEYTPGGLAWRSQWGVLRYTGNTAFAALMAADLGIEPSVNKAWAMGQIDYMLGDNPRQSSYVVGYGNNSPKRPHHKSSICKPKPANCGWDEYNADTDNTFTLYGALVGGPNKQDGYVDDRKDYVMAEVTCDYNAGFQSAVAGLIHFDTSRK